MKPEELKEGMIVWYPVVSTFVPSYKLKRYVVLKVSKKTVLLENYDSGERTRMYKDTVVGHMFASKKEALEWILERLEREHKYFRRKAKELSKLKRRAKAMIQRIERGGKRGARTKQV